VLRDKLEPRAETGESRADILSRDGGLRDVTLKGSTVIKYWGV
jgi:hypothetical protein